MDDWGFGIWIVPVALSTALCYVGAQHFESGQTRMAKAAHLVLLSCSWIGFGLVVILLVIHL